jgi:hypothetical protein
LTLPRLDSELEHHHVVRNATVFNDHFGIRIEEPASYSVNSESSSLVKANRPDANVGGSDNHATKASRAGLIDYESDSSRTDPASATVLFNRNVLDFQIAALADDKNDSSGLIIFIDREKCSLIEIGANHRLGLVRLEKKSHPQFAVCEDWREMDHFPWLRVTSGLRGEFRAENIQTFNDWRHCQQFRRDRH